MIYDLIFRWRRTDITLYEPCAGRCFLRNGPDEPTTVHQQTRILLMAVTPSKDYKRREREQRKLDKRMAREAAKSSELEAQQAAADAAEASSEAGIQAKLEADFEAELKAELEASMVA
jgi:hypothetical protein